MAWDAQRFEENGRLINGRVGQSVAEDTGRKFDALIKFAINQAFHLKKQREPLREFKQKRSAINGEKWEKFNHRAGA